MQYALHRGEGFVMVTGKPGTGKTTLINDLIAIKTDKETVIASIVTSQLEAADLLRLVLYNFSIDSAAEHKSTMLTQLQDFLVLQQKKNIKPLLIIDEAQGLSDGALEELRLLTNLHKNNKPLLQIFLVGQEGLRELILMPHLEQLHQRIIAACHIQPLNQATTKEFIQFRLKKAGWINNNPTIDDGVYNIIHQFSIGIPRWINLICSRLLLHGMVEEKTVLTSEDINSVTDGLIQEQLLPRELEASLNAIRNSTNQTDDDNDFNISEQDSILTEQHADETESFQKPSSHPRYPTRPSIQSDNSMNAPSESTIRKVRIKINGLSEEKLTNTAPKKLFERLSPQLFGKPQNQRFPIFLKFINGMNIDGEKLQVPVRSLQNNGPTEFLVWLNSNNTDINEKTKHFLKAFLELMDR